MKIQNANPVKNIDKEVKNVLTGEGSKSSKIKKLFELGLEVKEISTHMNIRYNFAYNVISNYVNMNDIPITKNQNTSQKDNIIGLFQDGKTNIEISKQLKINYNYVYKVLKEYQQQLKNQAK